MTMASLKLFRLKFIDQLFHIVPALPGTSACPALPPAKRAVSHASKHALARVGQFTVHSARDKLFVHNGRRDATDAGMFNRSPRYCCKACCTSS
jgi:hypothetical protein